MNILFVLWRCGRGRGAKGSKSMRNVVIFMIFDDFSQNLIGPGRGSVKRYGHIYFLDRSRCPMSKFFKTFVGLKGAGAKN